MHILIRLMLKAVKKTTTKSPTIYLIMKNLREWINEFFIKMVFDRNKCDICCRFCGEIDRKPVVNVHFIEYSSSALESSQPMKRKEFKHAKMGLKLKCYWQLKAFLSQHCVREQASCSKQRISPLFSLNKRKLRGKERKAFNFMTASL